MQHRSCGLPNHGGESVPAATVKVPKLASEFVVLIQACWGKYVTKNAYFDNFCSPKLDISRVQCKVHNILILTCVMHDDHVKMQIKHKVPILDSECSIWAKIGSDSRQ